MGRRGQAMVEFALVLPLLMIVMSIILAGATIYGVKIEEHKAAYDAARHVAKTSVSGHGADDTSEAQRVLQLDYDHSTLMHVFTTRVPQVVRVDDGKGPGPGITQRYGVEVVVSYSLRNVPGWDFLNSVYGSHTSDLQETGVAAKVF